MILNPVNDFLGGIEQGRVVTLSHRNVFGNDGRYIQSCKKHKKMLYNPAYLVYCIGDCAEERGPLDGIIQQLGFNLRMVKKAWGEED